MTVRSQRCAQTSPFAIVVVLALCLVANPLQAQWSSIKTPGSGGAGSSTPGSPPPIAVGAGSYGLAIGNSGGALNQPGASYLATAPNSSGAIVTVNIPTDFDDYDTITFAYVSIDNVYTVGQRDLLDPVNIPEMIVRFYLAQLDTPVDQFDLSKPVHQIVIPKGSSRFASTQKGLVPCHYGMNCNETMSYGVAADLKGLGSYPGSTPYIAPSLFPEGATLGISVTFKPENPSEVMYHKDAAAGAGWNPNPNAFPGIGQATYFNSSQESYFNPQAQVPLGVLSLVCGENSGTCSFQAGAFGLPLYGLQGTP